MEWPKAFYRMRRGDGCPMCEGGRPDASPFGVRFFVGEVSDAYLHRPAFQRGFSFVVWRGRHVAEPTELTEEEAARYFREVLMAGRAIERVLQPVKVNYDVLGNSVPHLHTHVMPRYAADPRPGWPFPFPETDPPDTPEDELLADAEMLRRAVAEATSQESR
jgi:diadenosine tetraphosphate (Ap4A) HIT family hydrolase